MVLTLTNLSVDGYSIGSCSLTPRPSTGMARLRRGAAALAFTLLVAGCGSLEQSYQRGYVVPEGALEQIPLGSEPEQVLIVLGTPPPLRP